jgi:hypothetical protein
MATTWKARHQALNKAFTTFQQNALNLAMVKHMTARLTATNTATQSSTTLAAVSSDLWLDDYQANSAQVLTGALTLSIANAAHNIKFDLAGGTMTAASVSGFARFSLANGTALLVPITALNTSIDGSTTNAWIAIEFNVLIVTATPGSLIPQFAQSASGATNSSITGGYLRSVNLN